MKIIVLLDPVWAGHVPTYHKYFAQVLLELDYNVLSISPNPDDVLTWIKRKIPDRSDKITCVLFELNGADEINSTNPPFPKLRTIIKEILKFFNVLSYIYDWMNLKRTIIVWEKAHSIVDKCVNKYSLPNNVMVFFPYIDYLFLNRWLTGRRLEHLFPYRWAALYFHPTHLRKNPGYHHRLLCPDSIFFSRNCMTLSILDETLVERVRNRLRKPIVWFPDITDNLFGGQMTTLAKSILDAARGRKIVTLIGGISQKKNLVLLLKTAEMCAERHLLFFFVVAGMLNLDTWDEPDRHFILDTIQRKPDNVFFHLERVPDDSEYNSLFVISEIIFAAYSSFYHSSNSLTKAAIFERPVVVSEGHLMAERVAKYRIGLAIPEGNIDKCLEALNCLADRIDYKGAPLEPRYKEYRELHSQDTLRSAFADLLSSVP